MKRIFETLTIILAVLCLAGGGAQAAMQDRNFTVSVIGNATGTVSYVLRGELHGIYIDVAASSTQTVTLASDEQTLYTEAGITADAWRPLLFPQYGSTGSALVLNTYGGTASTTTTTTNSLIEYGTNNAAIATNSIITYGVAPATTATANPVYGRAPLAGDITLTVIGAGGTATNSTTVTVVVDK